MSYGQGSIARRGGRWWITYWHRGKRFREAAGARREDALALLKLRQGEGERTGRVIGAAAERLTLRDLIETLEADYSIRGRKSKPPLTRLREHFGEDFPVLDFRYDVVTKYMAQRRAKGAAINTTNNEVAVLGKGLTLLHKAGRLPQRPPLPWIEPNNARQGFVEQAALDRLLRHLEQPLRAFTELAFYTGWRRSELTGLEWRRVSFERGEMWLDTSKNGEGRTFPLSAHPRVEAVLREQRERVERIQRERGFLIANVFVHDSGIAMRGWFYDAWRTACDAAGLEGLLVHDLRRSAVRNLTRAGVAESVAMKLTGHKTRDVFDRYDIKSNEDMRAAVAKLAEYHGPAPASGHVLPMPRRRAKA